MSSRPPERNIEDLAKLVKSNDILQKRIEGDYEYLGEGRNSSATSFTSEDSREKTGSLDRKISATSAKSLERVKSVEKTQQATGKMMKSERPKAQMRAPVIKPHIPHIQRRAPVVVKVVKVQKSPSYELTNTPAKSPVSPSDSVPTPGHCTPVSPSSLTPHKPKNRENHQETEEEEECCCCFLCWCWCCCPR